MLLHKLRRAMVNAAREPRQDEIEVDEGGLAASRPAFAEADSSRGRAALVMGAVERRGRAQAASE
jgi:hypothetical protein